jgi:hypothetical protein
VHGDQVTESLPCVAVLAPEVVVADGVGSLVLVLVLALALALALERVAASPRPLLLAVVLLRHSTFRESSQHQSSCCCERGPGWPRQHIVRVLRSIPLPASSQVRA